MQGAKVIYYCNSGSSQPKNNKSSTSTSSADQNNSNTSNKTAQSHQQVNISSSSQPQSAASLSSSKHNFYNSNNNNNYSSTNCNGTHLANINSSNCESINNNNNLAKCNLNGTYGTNYPQQQVNSSSSCKSGTSSNCMTTTETADEKITINSILDKNNCENSYGESSVIINSSCNRNNKEASVSTAGKMEEPEAGNETLTKNSTDHQPTHSDHDGSAPQINHTDNKTKENKDNNNSTPVVGGTTTTAMAKRFPAEFAHPIHEAPAKCNLIDSVRSLFLDVIVTNAVSPLNFSIQSYHDYGKRKLLEEQMTIWYESTSNEPLTFQKLVLNGYYAVKYLLPHHPSITNGNGSKSKAAQCNDTSAGTEQWRRCQIIKPFSQSLPILTYLVDHGCYFMTEPKNIQPLRKIYCELPCQSLEAKLHFVDTKKVQFTPEDCHRFHKQVEGKPFCSIIMKPLANIITNNEAKEINSKISVVLIDTSTAKDYYIHHDYIVPKKNC